MTTAKQAIANRRNASKSTGPTTLQGRANASGNAMKHSLLSSRLFLDDENPEEFQFLLGGLHTSLRPNGSLESALVERIAVAIWRQQRLIRAETAHVELNRRLDIKSNRHQVERALGMAYPEEVEGKHLRPIDDIEAEAIERCNALCMEHIVAIDVIRAGDLTQFAMLAPQLHAVLPSY
ncbi:hypothetical protein NQS38_14950 [Ralstonia pseudosolanacearum]|uniref:hypothetical protein n=1 Tax=Ralstonia pseudosolanacearum TaxID=1310165 RepID=UPI0013C2FFE5|nr:hypothetical protein [Ralstonia pseudosolanacearum]UYR06187.1 hypothetical protein NQS38_14950 [Ralstonia pseudosolanacearum]